MRPPSRTTAPRATDRASERRDPGSDRRAIPPRATSRSSRRGQPCGSYVLVASFLIFNLFIGIVISSMEGARAIELHRAERQILDEDDSNDARAHGVILRERLHHLKNAVGELERDLAAQERSPARR